MHLAVDLWHGEYQLLHGIALALDACSYNIFVAQLLKLGDVGCGHKPRVGHDDEVLKVVLAHKLLYHREHRVPLILVALMDAVGQRVAAQAHQQPQNNLRVAVPSFLREACPAQVVLTVGLEVQGGHVVENDPDMATKHLQFFRYSTVAALLAG